jgi:putative FmdB family regulatory protein
MPIFEYKCNKCNITKDKLVSRSDADADKEFECECENGMLTRTDVISSAALRFKGQWYSTTRNY